MVILHGQGTQIFDKFNGRSTTNWVFLPQPTETHRFLFLSTTTEIGIFISLFKFQ